MKLRERFWLWGHPEGCYNGQWGNNEISRMTPMEACLYLGIRNTFMVPVGINVNRRQYNKAFTTLRHVGWECFDAGSEPEMIERNIEEAKEFPNINCVVFDDFKCVFDGETPRYKFIPFENIERIMDRVHNNDVRRLDSWMVLYTYQFGVDPQDDQDFQPWMDAFDGIIMWTWEEKDVPLIPEKWEIFKKLTPRNRRMFGCYLYNFGENKKATAKAVKWQLDFYLDKIRAGEAEGVVLHTNTMADLDHEAYDAAIEWMKEHGDEIVPDID